MYIHIYTQSRWWFQPILQRIGVKLVKIIIWNHHLPGSSTSSPTPKKNINSPPTSSRVPCFTSSQDAFRWSFDESVRLSEPCEWLWGSKEGVFKVTSSGVSTCEIQRMPGGEDGCWWSNLTMERTNLKIKGSSLKQLIWLGTNMWECEKLFAFWSNHCHWIFIPETWLHSTQESVWVERPYPPHRPKSQLPF